jgi:hypothetical protein
MAGNLPVDENTRILIKAAMRRAEEAAETVPWWHFMHHWSRWELGTAETVSAIKTLTGVRKVQIRHCLRCNLHQSRGLRVEL